MAARRTRKKANSKKVVTISVDESTLLALQEAVESLSEFAAAWVTAVDDPKVRAKLTRKRTR